jgi:hypothetical protein
MLLKKRGSAMKHIIPVFVIFLCIALLAVPATAASDKGGNPSGENPDQPQITKSTSGAAGSPAVQVRETLRQETRLENPEGNAAGSALENRTETRLENQAVGAAGDLAQNRAVAQVTATAATAPGQAVSQLRETIRLERQQMNATAPIGNTQNQQRIANQNEVYLAVHTLLAMENLSGGIGPQVSVIAREFNNSAQSTWQYEDRIRNRDPVTRLLFGGDQAAAGELNGLAIQNENRIRQIEQLMNSATLDPETRAMLEEQLRTLEQENTRLAGVSAAEQKDLGIFGWIGK